MNCQPSSTSSLPPFIPLIPLSPSQTSFTREDTSDIWQEALPAMHSAPITSLSVAIKR